MQPFLLSELTMIQAYPANAMTNAHDMVVLAIL